MCAARLRRANEILLDPLTHRLDAVAQLLGDPLDRALRGAQLAQLADQPDRLRLVRLLLATDDREVVAEVRRSPSWLRVVAGCIGADERTLLLAAQRLVHLPTVRRWLAGGTHIWPSAALGSRRDGLSSSIHDGAANPAAHMTM